MIPQQKQTLEFFDRTAAEWRRKAEGEIPWKVGVIAQRNRCVVHAAERLSLSGRFLDIGCGTGELTLDMASRGFEAWGLDFAPAMIELCERKAAGAANAHFQQASFFDFPAEDGAYALLSAQGLIEYISPEQLDELFAKTIRMLRPGGAFVVGSRNRLFNVFSLSAYTELELKLGSTAGLIGEALALVSAADQAGAIEAVRRLNANYPLVSSHPLTGIGVDTRHQYAPSELIRRAEAAGYRADLISPVHYHCFCVPAAQRKKEVYVPFAEMMAEEGAEDHRLIPYSSTFVLTAVKP